MMDKRLLYGVVCASITPMHADGSVDEDGVRRLCRHLTDGGVHCLYPNGTNGESISLLAQERRRVATLVAEENAGKAVLYVQCGSATVAESYEHVRHARELGADGAGLMTPVFFALDRAAMRRYYEEILKEVTDLPIYVYNISPRTGTDIDASLLGELMDEYPNLMGIKYSYPDPTRMLAYVDCCKTRKASVLVGNDAMASYCLLNGGVGFVSGPCAVFVKRFARLYDALTAKQYEEAALWQRRIAQTARLMSDIPEIPAIKYMLKRQGIIDSDVCRAPLRPLDDAEKRRLDGILETYLAE